jgi:hypothetical protein
LESLVQEKSLMPKTPAWAADAPRRADVNNERMEGIFGSKVKLDSFKNRGAFGFYGQA